MLRRLTCQSGAQDGTGTMRVAGGHVSLSLSRRVDPLVPGRAPGRPRSMDAHARHHDREFHGETASPSSRGPGRFLRPAWPAHLITEGTSGHDSRESGLVCLIPPKGWVLRPGPAFASATVMQPREVSVGDSDTRPLVSSAGARQADVPSVPRRRFPYARRGRQLSRQEPRHPPGHRPAPGPRRNPAARCPASQAGQRGR